MILLGDCLVRLKELPDNSVDSVVTDPPYGWRFMGKAWDGADIERMTKERMSQQQTLGKDGKVRASPRYAPSESAGKYDNSLSANQSFQFFTEGWAKEALRVLKPGGHMLVFCGPRTYHRMASGVEDAGFEIRDQLQWLFGSGFPKSHNLGGGMGTALKPANEPIVLARKPLSESTVAKNVLKWGVGGLNIDASRIGTETRTNSGMSSLGVMHDDDWKPKEVSSTVQGRWPANILLDETAAEMLDAQSGPCKTGVITKPPTKDAEKIIKGKKPMITASHVDVASGASRFFYCAKASKSERNAGLEGMPEKECGKNQSSLDGGKILTGSGNERSNVKQNFHPTVKPLKLMEYLIKLITPPNGTVLDPFMGSGSTGVAAVKNGFKFIGCEMSAEYVEIAEKRIANVK